MRPPPFRIAVTGTGVAASCCTHLLARRGLAWRVARAGRRDAPAVMLTGTAVALMRDVLGRPDLFADRPRITRRIVAWGGGDPVAMPHDAIVVGGAALAAALDRDASATGVAGDVAAGLTIATDRLTTAAPIRFGARVATASTVRLRDEGDAGDCWIEALDAGWLFLIPSRGGMAWLLSVGLPLDEACDRSRHVATRIIVTDAPVERFDPVPRLAAHTSGADWIGCGRAAIAFDPICGDGTAQAIRAAILAAAVVAEVAAGSDRAALMAHYDTMLVATMRRHLQLCAPFYRSGGTGPWWRGAHDALAQGHDWCTRRLATAPEPRYVLRGFDLVRREQAA